MKRLFVIAMILSAGFVSWISNAYTVRYVYNINVTEADGYAVDENGYYVTFTNTNDPQTGLLTNVVWARYRQQTKDQAAVNDWTWTLPTSDFPPNTTNCDFVAIIRNTTLVVYSDIAGNATYVVYRLSKSKATNLGALALTPAEAATSTFSMYSSRIYRYNNVNGLPRIITTYNQRFRQLTNPAVIGQGVLAPVNPALFRYYMDTSGAGVITVRIIRP